MPAASFVARRGRRRRPGPAGARLHLAARASAARSPSAELADRSARLAGALAARGVGRGDVVMTVLGNRPEWAYAMVACWRLGAVAQPCTEQLRPADLRARMELVGPRAVVADERDLDLVAAAGFDGVVLELPDPRRVRGRAGHRGGAGPDRPRADRLHLRHRRRAEAGAPRARLSRRPARPGGALVRRAAGRPLLVHRGERLVAVGPQRLRRGLAARRDGAAPRRALRPGRAARPARARARGRALHVPHRVPGDREARRAALAAGPAPRLRRRRAAQPGGGARLAGRGGRPDPRRLRPDRDRPSHRHADRPAGAARLDGPPAAGLPGLDRRGRARDRPRHGAHLLPRRAARPALAHRRPGERGRGRLPLVRGPHRRRDHLRRLPDRPLRGRVRARVPPGRGRGGRRGGARRRARPGRARRGRAARRLRAGRRARPRAPGARQGDDGALQVSAHRRLRRGAAEDAERQDQARGAARG